MSNKRGNKRSVDADASHVCQHKKGRKENGVEISDTLRYYYPYEWKTLSIKTKSKLLSNPMRIVAKEKRAGDKKNHECELQFRHGNC